MAQHDEIGHRLIEDAIDHVLFPKPDESATPEHRLTLQFHILGQKIDALPERIALALRNGNGNSRWGKVKKQGGPAVVGSGLTGILFGLLQALV